MNVRAFIAIVLLTAANAFGAGSGDILGLWKTDGGDSRLEFFSCGDKICGKIVWLKEPKSVKCAWHRPIDWNCAAISEFLLSAATLS